MSNQKKVEPAIHVRDLNFIYNDQLILKDINFFIDIGSLVAIVGPNGAGKTTLLNALIGLHKPVSGTVSFFGYDFESYRKKIAYVPQRLSIDWDFPVSVYDVVMMGRYPHLGWFKRPTKYDFACVEDSLYKVGLLELKDRHIGALSGGQQQRVFLARALAQDALIYLMDEPFVGIDKPTELMIINLLKKLRSEGKSVVVVHHDITTLVDYFDKVLLLNKTIIGYGQTEDMLFSESMKQVYGNKFFFNESSSKLPSNY